MDERNVVHTAESLDDLTGFRVMTNDAFNVIAEEDAFPLTPYSSLRLRQFYEWANRNMSHPLSEKMEREVWALMEDIQSQLENAGLKGVFLKGGSYYEGAKVGYPDEFDYMFELSDVTGEDLKIRHTKPPTYKPKGRQGVVPRSYYKVRLGPTQKESSTLKWLREQNERSEAQTERSEAQADKVETQNERSETQTDKIETQNARNETQIDKAEIQYERSETQNVISARNVMGAFSDLLKKILGSVDEVHADLSGPAVTVYLTLTSKILDSDVSNLSQEAKSEFASLMQNFEKMPLKIDIALAIPLHRRQEQTWPLEGEPVDGEETEEKPVQLADRIKSRIDKCHLVASGDFWKVSFAEIEMQKMKEAPRQSKNVFMALKVSVNKSPQHMDFCK